MCEILLGVRIIPAHNLHAVVYACPCCVDVLVVVRVRVRRLPGRRRVLPALVGEVHDGHAAPVQQLLFDGVCALFGGVLIRRLGPVLRQDVAVLQNRSSRHQAVRPPVVIPFGNRPIILLGVCVHCLINSDQLRCDAVEDFVLCLSLCLDSRCNILIVGPSQTGKFRLQLLLRSLARMRLRVVQNRHPLLAAIGEQAFQHGAHTLRVQGGDEDGQAARVVGGVRAGV